MALIYALLLLVASICFATVSVYDQSSNYQPNYQPRRYCPPITLFNGQVLYKSEVLVKFICNRTFRLIGPKFASCVNGAWDTEPPRCARQGCMPPVKPQFGTVSIIRGKTVAYFSCLPNYIMVGSQYLFCDGYRWNGTIPDCIERDSQGPMVCDFDNNDLCGYKTDSNTSYGWIQHSGETPSRQAGTGPAYDHTFGEGLAGRYMYVESSKGNYNDNAILISPIYLDFKENYKNMCLFFWYHMFGSPSGMGKLFVSQRSVARPSLILSHVLEFTGSRGDGWSQAVLDLNAHSEPFKIIFEAVRGTSYLGDIAIDDVEFNFDENCTTTYITDPPNTPALGWETCKWVCNPLKSKTTGEVPLYPSCGCRPACLFSNTCCTDFTTYCMPPNVTTSATVSSKVPNEENALTTRSVMIPTKRPQPSQPPAPPLTPWTTTSSTMPPTTRTTPRLTTTPATPSTRHFISATTTTWTQRRTTTRPSPPARTTAAMRRITGPFDVDFIGTDYETPEGSRSEETKTGSGEEKSSSRTPAVLGSIFGMLGFAAAILLIGSLVRKHSNRKKIRRGTSSAEDSDVRFLTSACASDSEPHLDFTLSTPSTLDLSRH